MCLAQGGSGQTNNESPTSCCFTPDGRLDPTFGADGGVTTPFPGGDAHATAVVARQRKIVVAGVAGGKLTAARYLRDGRLDATFGNGGTTTVDIRKESGPGTAVAVGPRHRVIVASGTGGTGDLTVTELRGDGHLRRSFGRGGGPCLVPRLRGGDIA